MQTPLPETLVVELTDGRSYPVRFEPLGDLPRGMAQHGMKPGRCILVTDRTVSDLHGRSVLTAFDQAGWQVLPVIVPPGEGSKSAALLQFVYDTVLPWGIDRGTPLVALGGGVVGDLAGYAAATLLRGIPLVHVPTTLLAQIDSSIGGKTGINHAAGKNLIGAFHQPRLVWTDTTTLGTLPRREWVGGAAEVVKHALIGGGPLLAILERGLDSFLEGDASIVGAVIPEAIAVKARIVSADEHEAGVRAWLNFGHTFAHALERTLGYGSLTHGEAVAVGMKAALHLSRARRPDVPFDRAMALVSELPVPPIPADVRIDDLMAAMVTDKKVVGGVVRFVVLEDLGKPALVSDMRLDAVRGAWRYALERSR